MSYFDFIIQTSSSTYNVHQELNNLLSLVYKVNNLSSLSVKALDDGLTNKLYKVQLPQLDKAPTVLVKIFGNNTDLYIDRNQEILNFKSLNKANMAPNLVAIFKNGLVYGYTQGTHLTIDQLDDPQISKEIAKKVAKLHNVEVETTSKLASTIPTLKNMTNKISETTFKNLKYTRKQLQKEIKECETIIQTKIESKNIRFCHNDLLPGNIIVNKNENDIIQVNFIDYEYGAYNYIAFDIANHFNEYNGFKVDINKLPNKETRRIWIQEYIKESNSKFNTFYNLQTLEKEVEIFIPISHLFWGIWALLQADISEIEFDYKDYAVKKIELYYKLKEKMWN